MRLSLKNKAFAFLVTACMTGCSKFLERPPEGKLNEDQALVDESGLEQFLNGTFVTTAFEMYKGQQWYIADVTADEVNGILYSGDDGEFFNRKTSIFGAYKNDRYTQMNQVIYKANKILSRLDLASVNKDNIEGQALFLRALAEFELVRLWAQPWGFSADNSHLGIPLRNTPSIEPINRSTVKQVYDAVIADLQSAEQKLPATAAQGHPGQLAAKALLAKVFFQQNDFVNAFKYADEVIKSGKYQMDADDTAPGVNKWYTKRFSLGLSKEMIFGFNYVLSTFEVGQELRDRYRSDVSFSPQGDFKVTAQYYNIATQPGDTRALWYTPVNEFYALTKYNKDRFDVSVIHLTEIKLIRAESAAEIGGASLATAIGDINDILTRAYAGTSMNLDNGATKAEVIAEVRRQREFEMIGEGNRLQEIKRIGARTGTSIDRRGAPWNCPGFVLQFPQGEKAGNTDFIMNIEGGCN